MRISPVSFARSNQNKLNADKKQIGFGYYLDKKAESKAREILTPEDGEKCMKPCYDYWFYAMKHSPHIYIYIDGFKNLNYKYSDEVKASKELMSRTISHDMMSNCNEPYALSTLTDVHESIERAVNGEPEPKVVIDTTPGRIAQWARYHDQERIDDYLVK